MTTNRCLTEQPSVALFETHSLRPRRRRFGWTAAALVAGFSAPCWAQTEDAAAAAPAPPEPAPAPASASASASASATPAAAASTAATPCVCDPKVCQPNAGQPDPNAFRHDGFFLRITAGMGYMWGRGEPSAELDGYAGALGISVGSMLSENFALHFDMSGANAFRSGLSIEGSEDTTYNAVFQTTAVGLGATYYLMPANVYVTAGVGAGWLYSTAYARVDENHVLTGYESSNFGPSVIVGLGKEWWVAPDWGVGLTGVYQYLSVNGHEDLGKYTVDAVHNVTVRVSATFN